LDGGISMEMNEGNLGNYELISLPYKRSICLSRTGVSVGVVSDV